MENEAARRRRVNRNRLERLKSAAVAIRLTVRRRERRKDTSERKARGDDELEGFAVFEESRVQIGIKGRARVILLPAVLTGLTVGPGELQSIPRTLRQLLNVESFTAVARKERNYSRKHSFPRFLRKRAASLRRKGNSIANSIRTGVANTRTRRLYSSAAV